jgi:hypothetical protein
MRRVGPIVLTALAPAACAAAVLVAAGSAAAGKPGGALFSENTPGTYTWTVPKGVKQVTFDVYGASGGTGYSGDCTVNGTSYTLSGGAAGKGGEATATYSVAPGQAFEIAVGGQGQPGLCNAASVGGSNGGGGSYLGGSGGGASDVRGGSCVATASCDLYARFLVAGGGGGADTTTGADDVGGGAGGGLNGVSGSGNRPGGGGLQSGAAGGEFPGTFGGGGAGQSGGGGGWYGGGGGYDGVVLSSGPGYDGGGGGGSGFISRIAIAGSFPPGAQSGDGMVMIKKA